MSIMIGIGKNLRITPSGVTVIPNEPEVDIYIAGLVTPLSDGQIELLNIFVASLKAGLGITSLSDFFDVMYILAGETSESSLRNLVKVPHIATLHGTANPVFTALEGFTGHVANAAYINTNYNPNTQGSKFLLDNSSFGIYIRTNRALSANKIHGAIQVNSYLGIAPFRSAGIARLWINNLNYIAPVVADTLGMTSLTRPGVISAYGAKNKTMTAESTFNSVAIPNYNIYLLAWNNAGVAGLFDDIQISFAWLSKSYNQAQLNVIYDSFQAYMTANGKQV